MRNRKLLLHKEEISKLLGKVTQGGYTLIPYKMGFIGEYVKVELALCKGKKLYDKRESIKEREAKIRLAQAMKNNV
jgi:SsrA-binding protein